MSSGDCCDASDRLLTLTEALAAALRFISPIHETETVALFDAYGRVLAADLPARIDVPPHDNSAMDGFALYWADLKPVSYTHLDVYKRQDRGCASH